MKKLLLLPLLLLTGCTTYRVVPDSDNLTWLNGKGYQKTENTSLALSAAVDQKVTDTDVFYVEVTNKSKQSVVVGPDLFFLRSSLGIAKALDPEDQIASLTSDMKYQDDQSQPNLGDSLQGLSSVLDASNGETEQQRKDHEHRIAERDQQRQEAGINAVKDRQNIEYWQQQAFRRNTLSPGQKYAGFVKFQRHYKEGPLTLDMLTGSDDLLSIRFKVIKN